MPVWAPSGIARDFLPPFAAIAAPKKSPAVAKSRVNQARLRRGQRNRRNGKAISLLQQFHPVLATVNGFVSAAMPSQRPAAKTAV